MGNIDKYRFLEKFSYLIAARIVFEVLQAIFLIYLARKSTHAYGDFMLAFGIGVIICLFADFGLNQLLLLRLNGNEIRKSGILADVTAIKSTFFVAGWLGAVGFIYWQGYEHTLKLAVLVMGVGFGMQSLANSFFVTLQVNGRQDMEAGIRAVAATLGFGFGIVAVFSDASLWVVSCYKIVEGLTCCTFAVVVVRRLAQFSFGPPRLKELPRTVRGAAIFAFITVGQILNDKINLLFLKHYGGYWEIAQYSVAWQLVEGVAMLMVGLMLRSILFPIFARLWKNDKAEAAGVAQNTFLWLFWVSIPVMFILYVESDRIIQFVYGPEYQEAVWIQKCLVPTVLMNFMQFTAAYMMISMGKEKMLLIFYLFALALNFSLCSLVLPKTPILGALWAILFAKALIAIAGISYCRIKIMFIPFRPSLCLFLAGVAGVMVYVLCTRYVIREIAELMALFPVLGLGWKWKMNGFHHRLSLGFCGKRSVLRRKNHRL